MKKHCPKCDKNKDYSEFHVNTRNKTTGLSSYCKICSNSNSKQNYSSNREVYKEQNKLFKIEKRKWFEEYKSTLKCSKCPETHFSCLDFHHVDPKQKGDLISNMVRRGMDQNRVMKEIAKCIVLCRNCHSKFHYFEKKDKISIEKYLEI